MHKCSKTYEKYFNIKLIKRLQAHLNFVIKTLTNVNKCILLLRKGVYP